MAVTMAPVSSGDSGAPTVNRGGPVSRGLHSFALELNLSNSRTRSRVNLDYTVDRGAQVELKWERV
jgi:hypothetical protein